MDTQQKACGMNGLVKGAGSTVITLQWVIPGAASA